MIWIWDNMKTTHRYKNSRWYNNWKYLMSKGFTDTQLYVLYTFLDNHKAFGYKWLAKSAERQLDLAVQDKYKEKANE